MKDFIKILLLLGIYEGIYLLFIKVIHPVWWILCALWILVILLSRQLKWVALIVGIITFMLTGLAILIY